MLKTFTRWRAVQVSSAHLSFPESWGGEQSMAMTELVGHHYQHRGAIRVHCVQELIALRTCEA